MPPSAVDLGSNFAELRSLPASLGQLRALRTLTLSQNSLRALPASLGHLTQLHTLALDGNPLRYPPKVTPRTQLAESLRDGMDDCPLSKVSSAGVRRRPARSCLLV